MTYIPGNGYIPNNGNWMVCDICGHKYRASEMQRQPHGLWKGLWVCPNDYDEYNPQFEDVKAKIERIVPEKINIEGDSTQIGPKGGGRVGLFFSFPLGGDQSDIAPNYRFPPPVFGDGSHKITADDL